MNILKFYEAKAQNRKTVDFLIDLENSGLAEDLPGAMGLHYRKMDKDSSDYSPVYEAVEFYDKYHIDLLTCANSLNCAYNPYNGDIKVKGATHYCRHKHLCAVCGTKEARRISSQLGFMFYLLDDKHYDYYMLTLTIPNTKGGFKEGFDVINKTLSPVLSYCGYDDRLTSDSFCKGYFASREVTYNKKKDTWHPHIHVILAYEKGSISDIKISKKGYVRSGMLQTKRPRIFNVNSVMQAFINAIHDKFPDFDIPFDSYGNEFLNVDLRPITDIENSVNEICKYLIDYRCFSDADTLFIFLRDSFRLNKYTKRGCFGWSKEREKQWNRWLDLGRPGDKQTLHFMELQSEHSVYFGQRIGTYLGQKYEFPCYYSKDSIIDDICFCWNSDKNTYSSTFASPLFSGWHTVDIDLNYQKSLLENSNDVFDNLLRLYIFDDSLIHYVKFYNKKMNERRECYEA